MTVRFSKTGKENVHKFPGDYSGEATPVPIPNTEVKLSNAESTWDVGPWEDRKPPGVSFERVFRDPLFFRVCADIYRETKCLPLEGLL